MGNWQDGLAGHFKVKLEDIALTESKHDVGKCQKAFVEADIPDSFNLNIACGLNRDTDHSDDGGREDTRECW